MVLKPKVLDSDNIDPMRWPIMLKTAGMQKLKQVMDGLKLQVTLIDHALILTVTLRLLKLNLMQPDH